MSNGFWSGGANSYIKTLQEEERHAIQPLKDALRGETNPETKRSLKDQIKAIHTEFKNKRKSVDSSLFTGT